MGGKGGSGGTAISSLKARPYRSIFILCSGFVCRYPILPGGKRQVLNLVLPGDLIGFPTCFFENAINSLSSLTEVVVATVPFQAFYLILELLMRLRAVGLAEELSYSLPLTQELIADVLGLSGPHVSRMLRSRDH
jgi:CRP-like cAMP-binding protein